MVVAGESPLSNHARTKPVEEVYEPWAIAPNGCHKMRASSAIAQPSLNARDSELSGSLLWFAEDFVLS